MLMHKKNNNGTIKSDFFTSYLTFRGLMPTNSHQPQKQTRHHRKNLLSNHVTSLNYLIKQVVLHLYTFSFLLVLWFFKLCYHPIITKNRVFDYTAKGATLKPNVFLCCFRSNKNQLEYTHSQRYTCKSPHQNESLILDTL